MTKSKKKNLFSKLIITAVILLNIIFTYSVLYVFLKTGSEPTVLVGSWFGFMTVEVWKLAEIKKSKVGITPTIEGISTNENIE